MRPVLFRTVYYSFLPVGHAQAWLAETFRRTGIGLGWPLLLLWCLTSTSTPWPGTAA